MLFPPESLRDQIAAIVNAHREPADAAAVAREILALDPENAHAILALAVDARHRKDSEEAIRLFWKALELQPFGMNQYALLMSWYAERPDAVAAAHAFWTLALWMAAFSDEVDPMLAENLADPSSEEELDLTDPEVYWDLAEVAEKQLNLDQIPSDLRARIRPYWLLKELTEATFEGLDLETFEEIRAEAATCVPVWRAVVHAWGRQEGHTDADALMLSIALLGEFGGPDLLPDLWELSTLKDHGLFLHAHWALWRMAKRFPARFVQSVWAALPGAMLSLRCGMAEQLGEMTGVDGVGDAIVALTGGFPDFAHEEDASYLLLAATEALAQTGNTVRSTELLTKYERLLNKEGRQWLRESLEDEVGYEPMLVREQLPQFDIEDICVGGVLLAEEDEDEEEDWDEEDEDWDDEDEAEEDEEDFPKPGRNDPCWCGSGKKYKKCHLQADEEADRGDPGEEEDDDPVRSDALALLLETCDRTRKRRDLIEAGLQYFGEKRPDWAELDAGSEAFVYWYAFDFRPQSTGRTAVEELLRKSSSRLEPEIVEVLNAWRNSRYGLYEANSVEEGLTTFHDVFSGDTVTVPEVADIEPGDCLLARVESRHGIARLSGEEMYVPPEQVSAIREFVDREVKTTGAAPAEVVRANSHRLHRIMED